MMPKINLYVGTGRYFHYVNDGNACFSELSCAPLHSP